MTRDLPKRFTGDASRLPELMRTAFRYVPFAGRFSG